MSVTASINGNIQLTDSSTGTIALKKVLTALSFTGLEFSEAQSVSLVSGTNPITLPQATVQFAYIKNVDPTATINVTWTPKGLASMIPIHLGPGGSIMFFAPAGTNNGITALDLNSSATPCLVEYILAG